MYMLTVGLPDDVARLICMEKDAVVADMVANALRKCYSRKYGRVGSAVREAREYLLDMLKKGPMERAKIIDIAELTGLNYNLLCKAKQTLKISSVKIDGAWHWELDNSSIAVLQNRLIAENDMRVAMPVGKKRYGMSQGQHDEWSAVSYLEKVLREGPLPSVDVIEGAKSLGISGTMIKRAKKSLNIISVKRGFSAGWDWKLP